MNTCKMCGRTGARDEFANETRCKECAAKKMREYRLKKRYDEVFEGVEFLACECEVCGNKPAAYHQYGALCIECAELIRDLSPEKILRLAKVVSGSAI